MPDYGSFIEKDGTVNQEAANVIVIISIDSASLRPAGRRFACGAQRLINGGAKPAPTSQSCAVRAVRPSGGAIMQIGALNFAWAFGLVIKVTADSDLAWIFCLQVHAPTPTPHPAHPLSPPALLTSDASSSRPLDWLGHRWCPGTDRSLFTGADYWSAVERSVFPLVFGRRGAASIDFFVSSLRRRSMSAAERLSVMRVLDAASAGASCRQRLCYPWGVRRVAWVPRIQGAVLLTR